MYYHTQIYYKHLLGYHFLYYNVSATPCQQAVLEGRVAWGEVGGILITDIRSDHGATTGPDKFMKSLKDSVSGTV